MWYPLLYEILVTNLFQGCRIADMILNFANAVFDQSGSTFDTLLSNAALLVSVPLIIYDVVSHFTEAILQKQKSRDFVFVHKFQ